MGQGELQRLKRRGEARKSAEWAVFRMNIREGPSCLGTRIIELTVSGITGKWVRAERNIGCSYSGFGHCRM